MFTCLNRAGKQYKERRVLIWQQKSVSNQLPLRKSVNPSNRKQKITRQYMKIYSIVDDLFGYEQWLGKDARKYNEKIQGFRDNFKNLYNNFISYVNFLAKAAEAYDVAQDTAQSGAGKLTSKY